MRLQGEADGTRTRNLRIDSPVDQGLKWEPVRSYGDGVILLHQLLHQRNRKPTEMSRARQTSPLLCGCWPGCRSRMRSEPKRSGGCCGARGHNGQGCREGVEVLFLESGSKPHPPQTRNSSHFTTRK